MVYMRAFLQIIYRLQPDNYFSRINSVYQNNYHFQLNQLYYLMQIEIDIGKIIWQAVVYLFIAIFIGISQAAGIGGGPIINICLIIGLGTETKTSMAITYIFLIGGSVASIYSNYGKTTPSHSKNVIDVNLVIITLPMTVSGSIFGALFNHFISEFIITIAFTVLLSYLAYSSYKKFLLSTNNPLKTPILKNQNIQLQLIGHHKTLNPRLQQILKNQLIPFPLEKIKLYLQILGITVLLMLLKGGNSMDSIIGLQKCGFGSQICVLAHLIICYFYARSIAQKQLIIDQEKISIGYVFQEGENKMSESFKNKAMIFGFAGGFAGGMLGIGGAIILVPAWLEIGIQKEVVSASSAPLILSSALISTLIAFLCEYYDSFIMVIFYFILSFLASYYIKQLITIIKEKYKLQGMIYILLIIVMVMSLVFLLPYSFFKMLDDPEQFFEFGHMC